MPSAPNGSARPRHPVAGNPAKVIGKPLPAAIIGAKTLPVDQLRASLHRTTYAVYSILAGCRDAQGETHITVGGIARRLADRGLRITASAIRYQLARLRAAGLVEDLGWRELAVPHRIAGGASFARAVYVRRILGALVERADLDIYGGELPPTICYSVPSRTALWARGDRSHGGARRGAGRKRKGDRVVGDRKDSKKNQDWRGAPPPPNSSLAPDLRSVRGDSLESPLTGREGAEKGAREISKGPSASPTVPTASDARAFAALASPGGAAPQTPQGGSRKPGIAIVFDPPAEEPAPLYSTPLDAEGLHPSLTEPKEKEAREEDKKGPARARYRKQDRANSAAEGREVDHGATATIASSRAVADPSRLFFGSVPSSEWIALGVPRFPDALVLPMVFTPCPPLLASEEDPREHARRLLRYYHSACEAALKQKVFLLAKRPRVREYEEVGLARAAKALIDHRIAPASWAMFMLNVWVGLAPKERRGRLFPPLDFVWSEKWIRDPQRRQWFYSERASYQGGAMVPVKEAEELYATFDAMTRELRDSFVTLDEPDRVRAIVAKHFPGNSYREKLSRAWQESKATHAALEESAAGGGWCWR